MSDRQKKEEEASNDKNDKDGKLLGSKLETPDARDKRNARRRELYKLKREKQKAIETRSSIPGAGNFQNPTDLGGEIQTTSMVENFCDNDSEGVPKKGGRLDPQYREKERINKALRREDPEFRERERLGKAAKRANPAFRAAESLDMALRRENAEFRQREQLLKATKRTNPDFRAADRDDKALRRENAEFRKGEQLLKATKRANPAFRAAESLDMALRRENAEFRQREQLLKATKRTNPDFRAADRDDKALRRENAEFRKGEQLLKATKRANPAFRAAESLDMALRRENAEFRQREQLLKATKRTNPDFRAADRDDKALRRENAEFRKGEQLLKATKRANPDFRAAERIDQALRRKDPEFREKERLGKSIKKGDPRYLEHLYSEQIKDVPTHRCEICSRLCFRISTTSMTKEAFQALVGHVYNILSGVVILCKACYAAISKGQIPKYSPLNGFCFPDVPVIVTELSNLEQRLVSPRIPFISIRSLGCDSQKGSKGTVVNVPCSVDTSCSVLPRLPHNTHTIQIKLMRRMQYANPFLFETVRPKQILEALKFLVGTPLYRKNDVTLSEELLSAIVEDTVDFVVNENDRNVLEDEARAIEVSSAVSNPPETQSTSHKISNVPEVDSDEEWNEEREEETVNCGNRDSLLLSADDLIPSTDVTITFAPGEGSRPASLLFDEDCEELSFTRIYGGQKRNITVKYSYQDLVKWELLSADRRCAIDVTNIFFKWFKIETLKASQAIQICLRKTKASDGRSFTAGRLRTAGGLESLINHDDGFRILENIRNSPAFWQSKSRELLAMARQLGIPSFFLTVSAAETRWPELLNALLVTVGKSRLTDQEIESMPFKDKATLIQNDPITCARYFDHRFRALFKFLRSKAAPLGSIVDFYYRVEFQHRGSPHIHSLIWVSGAPKLKQDGSNAAEVEAFADYFISCAKSQDEQLAGLIALQTHKHTKTCKVKRGETTICRFGIPWPPMPRTYVFDPDLRKWTKPYGEFIEKESERVEKAIAALTPETAPDTFEEFFSPLSITEQVYIDCVTLKIKKKTILLKRSPREVKVNAYNKDVLRLWRANMDIQFVLDAYACIVYIIAYIGKSQRGISQLLLEAMKAARQAGSTVKERLKIIANKFLSGQEVSAQEAAYLSLQMPVSKASRASVYINTNPPEKRVHILRPKSHLDDLPEDSTDIFADGLLDRYPLRPDTMDSICLAEFAAWYEYNKKKGRAAAVPNPNHDEGSDSEEEPDVPSVWLSLKNSKGFVRKRTIAKIIRFRNYSIEKDTLDFYREHILLYFPWRNEATDIMEKDFKEIYETNLESISLKRREFVNQLDEGDFERARTEYLENEAQIDVTNIQPILEHQDARDREFTVDDPEFAILSLREGGADIGRELPDGTTPDYTIVQTVRYVEDNEYAKMVQSLNKKQREVFGYILGHFKTKENQPLRLFVTGGAGVGKSVLINSVYEGVTRHFHKQPGADNLKVIALKCAYTGKAGFNIGGTTLHTAFSLPVSQYRGPMSRMESEMLNKMRVAWKDLKLIIIDEISMAGVGILMKVNSRCQEIMGSQDSFGGLSILVVGDFNQLKPVGDSFAFQIPKARDSSYAGLLCNNPLWEEFKIFSLTEIMRQKEDKAFAIALNRMAVGKMEWGDISLIERQRISVKGEPPLDAVHLYATNKDAEEFNNQRLGQMGTESCHSLAIDNVKGDFQGEIRQNILTRAKDLKPNATYGLSKEIRLQIGGRYMVTNNIDIQDGIVNGATGRIRQIDYGVRPNGDRVPLRVWLSFDYERVGKDIRAKSAGLIAAAKVNPSWTPLEKTVKSFNLRHSNKNVAVSRKQFPLQMAEAITIHKSQGDTYKCVVVHISTKRRMERSMLYVACSRATSAQGLYIAGDFVPPMPPSATDAVRLEMERMQRDNQILIPTLQSRPVMFFHNPESLRGHLQDVIHDDFITNADLLLFVEVRAKVSDDISIPDFLSLGGIFLPDNAPERKSFGSTIYGNKNVSEQSLDCKVSRAKLPNGQISPIARLERIWLDCKLEGDKIAVVLLYKSPQASIKLVIDDLTPLLSEKYDPTVPTLVIGDFNIDYLKRSVALTNFFSTLEFELMTGLKNRVSTNLGTQLDLAFGNKPFRERYKADYRESTYSYHKSICIFKKVR